MPAASHRDAELARGLDEHTPEHGAVRVRGRHVGRLGAVVERVGPATGQIDELVAHDELAEREVRPERSRGGRAEDPPDAELAHRPDVRAVRDRVRRELVPAAVPRAERDVPACDLADDERRRRLPVRRVDLELLDPVEERVEARAAEDADLRLHARVHFRRFRVKRSIARRGTSRIDQWRYNL